MKFLHSILFVWILFVSCQNNSESQINSENEKETDTQLLMKNPKSDIIDWLPLSWEEVIRCNCLFAKNEGEYWDKHHFFARDSLNNIGLIKFKDSINRTRIPLIKSFNSDRTKGSPWKEIYSNDTIKVVLNAVPVESKIMNIYSYKIDFELYLGSDTIREEIIGNCNY